jgi:hypothetical protein
MFLFACVALHHLPASKQLPPAAQQKKKKQPIANMHSFPSMHMLRHVSVIKIFSCCCARMSFLIASSKEV